MRALLPSRLLIRPRITSSLAWHSTSVVPKNMERVMGRQLPGALGLQSKRKPDMSCRRRAGVTCHGPARGARHPGPDAPGTS